MGQVIRDVAMNAAYVSSMLSILGIFLVMFAISSLVAKLTNK